MKNFKLQKKTAALKSEHPAHKICKPFKEPRNRFQGIDNARQHRLALSIPGLLKRLQIRVQIMFAAQCNGFRD